MTVSPEVTEETIKACNETELLQLAKDQGLGRLRRGLPRDILVGIVIGTIDATPEHLAGTNETRALLESEIGAPDYETGRQPGRNWAIVRSQLPGCTGLCTKYNCSEGRHALCFSPNVNTIGT